MIRLLIIPVSDDISIRTDILGMQEFTWTTILSCLLINLCYKHEQLLSTMRPHQISKLCFFISWVGALVPNLCRRKCCFSGCFPLCAFTALSWGMMRTIAKDGGRNGVDALCAAVEVLMSNSHFIPLLLHEIIDFSNQMDFPWIGSQEEHWEVVTESLGLARGFIIRGCLWVSKLIECISFSLHSTVLELIGLWVCS